MKKVIALLIIVFTCFLWIKSAHATGYVTCEYELQENMFHHGLSVNFDGTVNEAGGIVKNDFDGSKITITIRDVSVGQSFDTLTNISNWVDVTVTGSMQIGVKT